ncbi:sialate O-acetylesterase [Cohnella soli]|uniref:Sialate O-acetylesterase n=1 Tax=Cohnella soli TaxID=425005 RepID=A0ABW0HJQ1_9BACL
MKSAKLWITKGIQHWAIVQQIDGYASLALEVVCETEEAFDSSRMEVKVRVILEETGTTVALSDKSERLSERIWMVEVERVPAGGLYRIELYLCKKDSPEPWAVRGETVHHVGVGDIWVIAGQSNAQGTGVGNYADAAELGIHVFRNNRQWDIATHPLRDDCGHSPYLSFAKEVKKEVRHPIGLLQTAVGATWLQLWNPNENGCLYREMLETIRQVVGKAKGILWYQGESDAAWYWYNDCNSSEPDTYLDRFNQLVVQCRNDLGQDDLPFLTVQLNRTSFTGYPEENRSWGTVREMQRRAAREIERVYVTSSLDCALSDQIHNGTYGNRIIGERLAKMALAEVYGKPFRYQAPDLIRAELKAPTAEGRSTVWLRFGNVQGNLSATDPQAAVFRAEDGVGEAAVLEWKVESKDVISLSLDRIVGRDVRIHGASEANPAFMLPIDTTTGMPILAFYGVVCEAVD